MRKMGVCFVVALALGCGSSSGGGDTGGGGGGGGSGGESSYEGAVASTDTALGQERYTSRCGSCHEGGSGPALANVAFTPARMRQQIREGSGQMPPIRDTRLSNEDMEAVLAYLQTIGAVTGGEATPAAE